MNDVLGAALYLRILWMNVFCVVDFWRRFIAHEGGWAGCKSDKTTFRSSRIWQCRGKLIKKGEIMLVDKGKLVHLLGKLNLHGLRFLLIAVYLPTIWQNGF